MSDALCRYLEHPTRRRLAKAVREYHDHVWSVALRVTGNKSDAEDLCQDVFLGLLLHPPAAGAVRSAKGYLAYRVVALAQRAARAARRRHCRETDAAGRILGAEPGSDVDLDALREALEALPGRVRATLELKYLAFCTVAEIASALEVSERTVASELQRGREELRTRLGKEAYGALLLPGTIGSPAAEETPADLLGNLLKIVDRGVALAPAAPPLLIGALAMKKTAASLIGVVLLLLAAGIGVHLVATGNARFSEQEAVVRETPTLSAGAPEGRRRPGQTDVLVLTNSNESPTAPEELQQELQGSLTLTVRTPDGDAIPGARVERPLIDDAPVLTDANGVAVLENLPLDVGFTHVDIRADGWARGLLRDVVLDEEAPHVATEVVLEAECRIVGRATDSMGNAVADCSVQLHPKIGSGAPSYWEETAVSGPDGRFEFYNLTSGVHIATASYASLSARLFPTPDSLPHFATGEPKIEFSFDRSRNCSLDVVLYPSIRLSGAVRSHAGTIAGATIQLEYSGPIVRWKTLRNGPTGEDGGYEFPSCAPGLYTARVWAPGHKTLTEAIELADPADETGTHEHDLWVEPGGIISGVLVRDGQPSRGKVAAFLKTTGGVLKNLRVGARAASDGNFAFQTLDMGREPTARDGTYVLRGLGPGVNDIKTGYHTIVEPLATDVEVDVHGGVGPSGVVVEAFRGDCTVRGSTHYPDGKHYPGAKLYVTSDAGGWKIEQPTHAVEEDGTFRIAQLPAGRTGLDVYPQVRSAYKIRKLEFDVEGAGAVVDLGEIRFEAPGNRSVVVRVSYLDPESDPEPGTVDVLLVRKDPRGSFVERIVGGSAVFKGLDPGVYQPSVDFTVHLPVHIEPIDLRDEERAEIEVIADPEITVHGDLTLAEGFPVQGAGSEDRWVPVRVEYVEGGRLSRIARLEGDTYRIQGLRPGLVANVTVLGAAAGRETLYAHLPGFSIVESGQEVSLGYVEGKPRAEK